MKHIRILALAAAACHLSFAAHAAQIWLLKYDVVFEVVVAPSPVSHLKGELITGTLSVWNHMLGGIRGSGTGNLQGDEFAVDLNFLGQDYDQTQDSFFDLFPYAGFRSFKPKHLDVRYEDGINGVTFADPGIELISMASRLRERDGVFYGRAALNVTSTKVVPLPAALPLSLAALGGLGALRLRRRED